MFDFEQIVESIFTFIKKGFSTFFISIFRPRYLFRKVRENNYQGVLKDYVYFILVFSIFNIFANINSPIYLEGINFFTYTKLFLDSVFNVNLQSKLLLNLPLTVGLYLFFYLFSLLFKENRSFILKICLYLSATYLIVSSSFADLLDLIFIFLNYNGKNNNNQGSFILNSERYGYNILGILIFISLLIYHLFNKKSRKNYVINYSFLFLIWFSLFLNHVMIEQEQKILFKLKISDKFAIFSEQGGRNEVDLRVKSNRDSTFLILAYILLKNNLTEDLILSKERTMIISDSTHNASLNGPRFELVFSATKNNDSNKFIIIAKNEFTQYLLIDTLSRENYVGFKKRYEEDKRFVIYIPFIYQLSDSLGFIPLPATLKIISNHE
jgi:hypothetical protein